MNTTAEPLWDKNTQEKDHQSELLRLINWYRSNKDREDAEKYINA